MKNGTAFCMGIVGVRVVVVVGSKHSASAMVHPLKEAGQEGKWVCTHEGVG